MEYFWKWLAGDDLPPGESLHFDFLTAPKGGMGLALLLGSLAVLVGIYLIYRRDAKNLSLGKRMTLAGLRMAALVSVFLILLEPNITKVRKVTRPGDVLLMVDSSQSMGHVDSYSRSASEAAAWKAMGIEDPSQYSRMELSKKMLGQKGLVAAMAAKNRLRGYRFGPGLRPLPEKEAAVDGAGKAVVDGAGKKDENRSDAGKSGSGTGTQALPPVPIYVWKDLEALDGMTNLSASVRQALEASRDTRIASLILVTDGRRNMGGTLEEIGPRLRRRKVGKVYIVPIGDSTEAWIMEIEEIQAAERSFKGDPVKVSALVRSQGYERSNVTVRLKVVEPDGGEAKTVSTTLIDIGGEKIQALATFPELKLDKEGEHRLIVEIEPPMQEDFDAERHRKSQKIKVLSERMRVLLIAGGPSHEFRVLRNQLIRDATIDATTFLLSADRDFPQDGNIPIKTLPKNAEEMDPYDVVILMDPDPNHPQMSAEFARLLSNAVTERGTGLWWVMGEKFSIRAVSKDSVLQPLVDLLPVVPDVEAADKLVGLGRYFKAVWPYKLTTAGKDHRLTRLHREQLINQTYWSKLPGYHFAFPVARTKPGASVLIRHSNTDLRGSDGVWPMLALQYVGAGRILYSGTDETYSWRSVAEQAYDTYWVKGLRYLYEGKLAGGSSRFRLAVGGQKVTLGDEIEIYLRALNERFEPLIASSTQVRVFAPNGKQEIVELKPTPQVPGRFVVSYRPNMLGAWKVQVEGPDGGGGDPVEFQVLRSQLESQGPANLAGLTRLAESAGGRIVRPDELAALVQEIPSQSKTEPFLTHFPLWDSWFSMLLVLGFLTLEWILRKVFDLL